MWGDALWGAVRVRGRGACDFICWGGPVTGPGTVRRVWIILDLTSS